MNLRLLELIIPDGGPSDCELCFSVYDCVLIKYSYNDNLQPVFAYGSAVIYGLKSSSALIVSTFF